VCVDRDRVGIEIEEPAATVDRSGEIAQVGERKPAADVIDTGDELDDAVTVGESEGAAVRAGFGEVFLDPGNGGGNEMCEYALDVERLPQRQSQVDAPGRRARALVAFAGALA
jgi:hypothetical protein